MTSYAPIQKNWRHGIPSEHPLANAKPLRTVHIRNSTISGYTDHTGFHDLSHLERRIHVQKGDLSVDVNLLEVAGAITILAGLVCVFIPSCLAVLTKAMASRGGQAAIEMVTRSGRRDLLGTREPGVWKRAALSEEYGCFDDGGNVCESGALDAILQVATVADGETASSTSIPSGVYSKVTNPDDNGSLVGWTYYCADNNACYFGEAGGEPVDPGAGSPDQEEYNV
ncbi:hypothetical protein FA10DRAFT_304098 [Acaromyces ingoldii]|uniref:Uncharacterized protein n=1 Tax=Acaromyces ingoldii TaxID=215250 RepID=A0A316YEI5_9BASI|nr:hypothetical protein FA10DRAFT_304098 [Acaromyces ingoldii]PWN87294.1 hypothetical protein FA10DRAFT_304098 [Acaromyces ingoldii]